MRIPIIVTILKVLALAAANDVSSEQYPFELHEQTETEIKDKKINFVEIILIGFKKCQLI